MTWYPIAFLPPQYQVAAGAAYSGAVLKAYAAQSSTVIPMATGVSGVTTVASFALNAAGYPEHSGNVIIPHVQQNYKLALYPTQAAADANSGAIWTVDDIQIADTENLPFIQYFSGDNATTNFTLSTDLGTDEKTVMIFADKKLAEYAPNASFDTDTIWSKGVGWTITGGAAVATGAISTDLSATPLLNIISGESYTYTISITRSAGGLIPKIGGVAGTERVLTGTYTETIVAGATQAITFTGNGFTGTITVVSVRRTTAGRREILRPDEYTVANTALTITEAPATGTNNIIVFAPSLLFGAVGAAAAAAATSETNAAASALISKAASGFTYTYSTTTAAADPGTGTLRFNNATLASATELYISETTGLSQAIAAEIATWDDSTSTIHGKLRFFKQTDPSVFAIFDVTGTITDNGGWDTVTIAYVTGSGSLSNNDVLNVQSIRNGDKGDTGATGATGGVIPFAAAGGTVDAITANFTPDIALADGQLCIVRSAGANTVTNPTFTPDGLTTRTIVTGGGQPLVPGDTGLAGYLMLFNYNLANTRWEFMNPAKTAEFDLYLSDVTTGDFSTTKHGFVPKGTNLGRFLKDDGTWAFAGSPPTRQVLTSGTGATYTTPANCKAIFVQIVGGGGGGGSGTSGAGSTGSTSTFNSVNAVGGGGGAVGAGLTGDGGAGGAGGTGGSGSATRRRAGEIGDVGYGYGTGGKGGNGPFGVGAGNGGRYHTSSSQDNATAGAANTGSGGGGGDGGNSTAHSGGGGGGGELAELIIVTPAASYTYTVGGGGAGGGSGSQSGKAGGSGVIEVWEFY